MSSPDTTPESVALGDVEPNGSRQLGRRSAVCWVGDAAVVGLDDGTVVAFDGETLDERWRHGGGDGSVVSLTAVDGGVLAGERGADGEIRLHDAATGAVRWRYSTSDDVGGPQQETRFFLPFVADAIAADEAAYVTARRYERGPDGGRTFRSVVYAFGPGGEVRWCHETDASPVSLSVRDDRVAVAFNRCPGEDRDGVRVLDAADGAVRRRWDPPGDGQRRAGDLALLEDGLVVASHADYRGYRLAGAGSERDGVLWSVDLGRPLERGDETVYAYPNHVHATDAGAVFVTGNTYPEEGREIDARHPNEHAAVGVGPGGSVDWTADTGGFGHEIAADGDRLAVPTAQHFRERDAGAHGVVLADVADGVVRRTDREGVAVAAAIADGRLAGVEEPVRYHDEDRVRGDYRLVVERT